MNAAVAGLCKHCGRANDESALVCALCGRVLRRTRSETAPAPEPTDTPRTLASLRALIPERSAAPSARSTRPNETAPRAEPQRAAVAPSAFTPTPWIYLAVGLATAPLFAWTPLLQYMGWFVSALVHEIGHCVAAWVCGMPAMPAISLAGEAAAMHSEQMPMLVAVIAIAAGSALWRALEGRARVVTLAVLAVLYPALAFTSAKELCHLLAGHGCELAFATLCLWKALDGGFTESRFERALYGTVGWYLLGKNAALCFGLMLRSDARAEYEGNGSFGLTNDYLRAAHEVLGWRLESVALLMLVASALVLPAAIALWRVTAALRAEARVH